MELSEKLIKIEKEIEEGFNEKSVRRLKSLINVYPNNINLRNRLAELYYNIGFFESAGKYWILTEPKDLRIENCISLYLKSVNYANGKILKDLKYNGDLQQLPDYSLNKINELYLEKDKIDKYSRQLILNNHYKSQQNSNSRNLFFALIVISIILIFFVGVFSIIYWVTN